MSGYDLILDGSKTPSFAEITGYMNGSAALLWSDFNSFITSTFTVSPKITYSQCSAKPGWNVKYQKSGKSLCTIYPEKDGFVVLVVLTLELVPLAEGIAHELTPPVMDIIATARPFNGTKWLMIPVHDGAVLHSVKKLLLLKSAIKGSVRK